MASIEQTIGRVRMHYAGEYDSTSIYNILDFVQITKANGLDKPQPHIYISLKDNNNEELSNTNAWVEMAVSAPQYSMVADNVIVNENDWETLSNKSPFTHKAAVEIPNFNINNNVGLALINNDIMLFSKYCFGIGEMPTADYPNTVIIYSIGQPARNIPFTFIFSNGENGSSEGRSLPIASKTSLGGIKVGDDLSITNDGVLNVAGYTCNEQDEISLSGSNIEINATEGISIVSDTSNNTQTYDSNTIALGENLITGSKGFDVISYDPDNILQLGLSSVEGIQIGDRLVVRLVNTDNEYFSRSNLTVDDLNNNIVLLDGNIPFTGTFKSGIVWVEGKPEIGDKILSRSTIAFGANNKAQGNGSFVTGIYNTAVGSYSHAEGANTISSGNYSHAEGNGSISSGNYSHTEGVSTNATAYASHAEGGQTIASAAYAHAEGVGTVANGENQIALGKWNVADTTSLRITGNGTNNASRKNIEKLTNTGDLRLKGNIYVGCNDDSTGGTKLGDKKIYLVQMHAEDVGYTVCINMMFTLYLDNVYTINDANSLINAIVTDNKEDIIFIGNGEDILTNPFTNYNGIMIHDGNIYIRKSSANVNQSLTTQEWVDTSSDFDFTISATML